MSKNYLQVPTNCPVCGHELEEDGKFLICPNDGCPALALGNLNKWISSLDIKDIGESTIEALYNAGKVNDVADFYTLNVDDIANLERLGEKSAKKILEHLKEKMELTLPEFLGSLNMHSFSTSRVEMLVDAGYDTVEKIISANVEQLIKIKGIEEKTANRIIEGMQSRVSVIQKLIDVGITIKAVEKKEKVDGCLNSMSFCFTGKIETMNPDTGKNFTRNEMWKLVESNGGEVAKSVTKGTNYLVMVDPNSTSSKAQKARKVGTKVLGEEDFFKMIGG